MSLESIDLSNCSYLRYLDIVYTDIAEVDLSGNPRLIGVKLDLNQHLKGLDVSRNNELEYLYVTGLTGMGPVQFSQLILGNQPQLKQLLCTDCNITSLDISMCPNLSDVVLNGNKIKDTSLITAHPNYDPYNWVIGDQRV